MLNAAVSGRSTRKSKPPVRGAKFGIPLFFLLLSLSLTTCGKIDPQVIPSCKIPDDQSDTITGHWASTPIPIAFHQGDFTASESLSIATAADTWNTFYTRSLNKKTLDYGQTNNLRITTTANPIGDNFCSTAIIQGTTFTGNVGIFKLTKWPQAYPRAAIGITTQCSFPAKPFPRIFMSIIELNYELFFSSGNPVPDLESVSLHELGHLLGLHHSCEPFPNKKGVPNCNNPGIDPDYVSASMYPEFTHSLLTGAEKRRSLGTNDEVRGNCLYR